MIGVRLRVTQTEHVIGSASAVVMGEDLSFFEHFPQRLMATVSRKVGNS